MLTLVLVLHDHQPVGNFDHVVRAALDRCYRPVLDAFARHPRIHFALHLSGPLLDWLEANEPSFLADVVALARTGQLEILGGAWGEPILPAIPAADASGQVRVMQDFWEARAGLRPTGFWLAERVWDPSLPALLAPAGVRYTFVDDALFRAAGLDQDPVSGHWVTERSGCRVAVLPIDSQLRYRIPFQPVPELLEHLRLLATRNFVLVYADDGEKLGLWPGTSDWVHERGWLRDFLAALDDHRDAIETALPAEVVAARPPAGRVYLPTGSYDELLAWSLPTPVRRAEAEVRLQTAERLPAALPFLRRGLWEGFLVKYPEANQLHKRMLAVSARLASATAASPDSPDAPPAALERARRHLYRAQCNCPYWHGLFGGLYLNHLRHAAYSHLIAADVELDRVTPAPPLVFADFDCDGCDEARFDGAMLVALIAPAHGGSLVELDVKPRSFNLLNTLARWEEAYHDARTSRILPGHEGRDEPLHATEENERAPQSPPLVFDRIRRAAFLDHLWEPGTSFDELLHGEPRALAEPASEVFALVRADPGRLELAWRGTAAGRLVELRKVYRVDADEGRIAVAYAWSLLEGAPLAARAVVEINFTLLAGDAEDRFAIVDGRREPLAAAVAGDGARQVEAVDDAFGFRLRVRADARRLATAQWRFPVETVSRGEAGLERAYQGSAWLWLYDVHLVPDGPAAEVEVALEVRLSP